MMVAEEFFVETEPVAISTIVVRDLVGGLNDVSPTGKVVVSEPAKEFVRQDGSTTQVHVVGDPSNPREGSTNTIVTRFLL
jgi:hypothetical protein